MDKADAEWLAQTRLTQSKLKDELAVLELQRQTATTRRRIAEIRSESIALNIQVNIRCQQMKAHA